MDKPPAGMTWQKKAAAAQKVVNLLANFEQFDALDVLRLTLVALLPGRNSGIKCPGIFD